MKKLAVIFPGIGYNIDKPLLYYTRKIALEHQYEVIQISFSDIRKECLKNKDLMMEAFNTASLQTRMQLKDIDFASCEDIIFVSKSIGTVAACIYAARYGIPARQVFFTPLPQTFSLVKQQDGLVFFGDRDPWIEFEQMRDICNEKKLHYRIIKGGNHSLETGQVYTDVENIARIIHEAEEYLVG